MPEIEITTFEGKSLLLVRVFHWKGPFYLKSKGMPSEVYIRLGSTNRIAGPEFLEELQRSFSKASFDQLPCLGVEIDGLDKEKIEKLFQNKEASYGSLESLGVLVRHGGTLLCSNGDYSTPIWDEVGTAMRVTFIPHTVTDEKVEPLEIEELSSRQKAILVLLEEGTKYTAKEILDLLGLQVSKRNLRQDLLKLKKQRFLETVGKGPSTQWKKIKEGLIVHCTKCTISVYLLFFNCKEW